MKHYRPRRKPPSAKLDEFQVYAIFGSSMAIASLATRFGVSEDTIRRVKKREGRRVRWLWWHWKRAENRLRARPPSNNGYGRHSYASVYGEANPWVAWLQKHGPDHATQTPYELRREMGVPAVAAGAAYVTTDSHGKAVKRRDYFR